MDPEPYVAITVAQANEVLTFVDWVRPHMHLEHYGILLRSKTQHSGEAGGDARAGLDDTTDRAIGVLTVTPLMWEDEDPTTRRRDIIHELLHAAHSRLSQAVYRQMYNFETQVGADPLSVARDNIRSAFEWWVDETSNWLHALLPVPWPTAEEAADHAEWRGWDVAWHNRWDVAI